MTTCPHGIPLRLGSEYTPDQCRTCWEFQNGLPRKCPALGQATGSEVDCTKCGKRVALKLFHCAAFGVCTVAKKVDGVACCKGCTLPHAEDTQPGAANDDRVASPVVVQPVDA
jgi:hypothetical protein